MSYHVCPGQDALFMDRIPMHFLFSLGTYVILNHMIPKRSKTKIFICCFTPTLTVTMEVLVSFGILSSNIGSHLLKALACGFLVALVADLICFYRKQDL